jgi:hypothetical protein
MSQTTEFINEMFAGLGDDETICVSKAFTGRDGDTGFVNVTTDDEEFTRWAARAARVNEAWYVCVGSVNGERNPKGRVMRGRSNLKYLYAMVLDDIGTKAEEPPVEPSWKLETSEGNWQWGYLLAPTQDFETYERLVKWCAGRGWADGGAGGAYRVVRIPGSTNTKPGKEGWKSRLDVFDPERFWKLDDLVREFNADLSEIDQQTPSQGMSVVGGAMASNTVVVDPVVSWLESCGSIMSDDGGQWVKVKCPNAAAHTSGDGSAGYSPLGRGEGRWVMTRAFKCLHDHCQELTTRRFLEGVAEEGGPMAEGFDPLPFYQGRYVFIQRGSLICDLERRAAGYGMDALQSLTDWGNAHRLTIPRGKSSVLMRTAYLEGEATQKAYDVVTIPSLEDRPWVNGSLNLYVPPTWEETSETPDMLLSHIRAILCSDEDANHFLDWLAFKVQNPAKRPYSMLMVTDGKQGIGRSVLAKFLMKMMPRRVSGATLGHLLGRAPGGDATYNDWATSETQWVVVEESKQAVDPAMFYKGYETFKELVDPSPTQMMINRKFGTKRAETLYFALLMFSNHLDALAIPHDDRRICVLRNSETMRDEADYAELWDDWRDPMGREHIRLWWYLMRRKVTRTFDFAPWTEAKSHMVTSNRSTQDEIVEDLKEDYRGVHEDPSWITRGELRDFINAWFATAGTPGRNTDKEVDWVWKSLPDAWSVSNSAGSRLRVGGVQVRLRRVPR